VGGVRDAGIADIEALQAGYDSGANAINPDIVIFAEYLTEPPDFAGFMSPELGKQAAIRIYRAGADVIYHAAGFSGVGVFEAAVTMSSELGRLLWAIGVDDDQYHSIDLLSVGGWNVDPWKPHILTSMLKRVDVAVELAITDFSAGMLEPGTRTLGPAEHGVGYSASGGFVNDLILRVESLRNDVVNGTIIVPSAPGPVTP